MRHALLLMLLVAALLAQPGCYYTATDADGVTRQIDRKEYQRLQKQPKATPSDPSWQGVGSP